ncbi:MAG: rod shape-determining protein MreC [Desulfococcaceae bacterium]
MFSKRAVWAALIALLILLNAVFILLSRREPETAEGPGRLALSLAAPLQDAVHWGVARCRRTWRRYFSLVAAGEENERLRSELAEVRSEIHRCAETRMENDRLRRLLRFRSRMTPTAVAAEVVARDPSPWFKSLTLDKGEADGLRRGLPVVVAEGVVGVVSQTARHYSRVLLIIDQNSSVDALVQATRARGVVKGNSSPALSFAYVLRRYPLIESQVLITSGLDGIYPKGLRIGRVQTVNPRGTGIFQEIQVLPFVDFDTLEEVLVILKPPPDEGVEPPP